EGAERDQRRATRGARPRRRGRPLHDQHRWPRDAAHRHPRGAPPPAPPRDPQPRGGAAGDRDRASGQLPRPRADDRERRIAPPARGDRARGNPRRSQVLAPYTPAVSSLWRPVRERAPSRSLMVVVAHPGDEAFGFGGAIARAAAEGAYVVVVCVTRGWFDPRLADKSPAPGGKNRDPKLDAVTWRNLDTMREDELRRSVSVL